MGLQDLTPQLRTRLNRVERAVGFFVTMATLLLLAGFGYYIYHTAQRKGWFKTRVQYSTGLNNAAGLKEGDPVKLMGFTVGSLNKIEANDPGREDYGVTVFFTILEPYYGYIWLDSKVRVAPADFLGNRNLEIIKGHDGAATVGGKTKSDMVVLDQDAVKTARQEIKKSWSSVTNRIQLENPSFTAHAVEMDAEIESEAVLKKLIEEKPKDFYTPLATAKPYWIEPLESPALTERLETVVSTLENALPNILNLTNQLVSVLDNTAQATKKLDVILDSAQPLVTNFVVISDHLREPKGSLGDWLLPTNLNTQLNQTLSSADATLISVQTNLTAVVTNLTATLENLANVTSNLNAQVQTNPNILSNVSKAVTDSDEFVQGLKRHWLLRSAFKKKKEEKTQPPPILRSPKDKER
ncbi:MAG: MlaD family protein [Verrucomicrobiota bacterium]